MIGPFRNAASGIGTGTSNLRRQAAGARITYRELDLRQVQEMEDLMRVLVGALALPVYFGYNLDALMEVLTDPQVLPGQLAVGLCGWQLLRRNCPTLFAALEDTLLDAQRDVAGQGRALYLLELDAPTWEGDTG